MQVTFSFGGERVRDCKGIERERERE